jgi:YfiH family protein
VSSAFERARSLASLGLEHGFGTAHTPQAVERLVTVRQVHGNRVLVVPPVADGAEADALLAREPGVAVGVFTADCVPVLLADRHGRGVVAVHAGWKGTAARVSLASVRELCAQVGCAPRSLVAAIGPHIGPCCYEVDRPVYDAFDDHAAFTAGRAEHWKLDLGLANRRQLVAAGIPVEAIERVGRCTACTPGAYASYRRDGTGQRMLHWIRIPTA